MPEYKLSYFNVKALGEPLRLLMSYGNLPFEDIRIEFEDWPTVKPTTPMGQMPVLSVDGKQVHQSLAMARYLANQVGLAGANDWENLTIDIVVDTINDFRLKIVAAYYDPDENGKEKKFAIIKKEVIPFYLEKLEEIARDNNGYLANGKLTWADLYFVGLLDYLNHLANTDLIVDQPNLQKVVKNVTSIESIKNWIDKRPQTDM
ncbi:glutathione S-transferase-like [Armigeres subalbatus]|uniref:glutathione S-transferase-like n=1 Tax=Armigeres subalbatus TaxID=124917 RepID=UPI002ED2A147